MSRLLVCPPDYFRINYEINPWMRRTNAVDSARAMSQWHALMDVLSQDVGAGIEQMPSLEGLPDMVFTANAGVVVGRRALVSRFRYPERQREEIHFERWFREQGYEVLTLDKTLYFEGAGDLLGFPDTWFGGYRQRSDIRAFPKVGDLFEREIIPLELIDARFYHLDTCFCPLSGGELLYFPPAFDAYGQAAIAQRVPDSSSVDRARGRSSAVRLQCGMHRQTHRHPSRLPSHDAPAAGARLSHVRRAAGRIYEVRRRSQVSHPGS